MISAAAVANPPAYGRARAVAAYDGVMRGLIHGFKYVDRHDARRLFGTWLVSAAAPLLPGITLIVPVPLAWTRLVRRQFNQAAILAQETSRLTGIPYAPDSLKRIRATRAQLWRIAHHETVPQLHSPNKALEATCEDARASEPAFGVKRHNPIGAM